jgi:hypothetical protein
MHLRSRDSADFELVAGLRLNGDKARLVRSASRRPDERR